MLNLSFRFSVQAFLAATLVLLSCSLSYGDNVTWLGRVDNTWELGLNWDNFTGPAVSDSALLFSGTVDFTDSDTSPNLRAIVQDGGTLNISGSQLSATQVPSAFSRFNGEIVQTGGSSRINAVEMGSTPGGEGAYTLNGGEFRIERRNNDYSLFLGASRNGSASGIGRLTVAGGRFLTRGEVKVGDSVAGGTGVFTVLGSQASEIGIGGANDDINGVWEQGTGSSLVVRVDAGGCTPIFVHDNQNVNLETPSSATFESGSILDVGHLVGDGGGTWTVMEVENGNIIDQGLAFAPGVDTSVWSFRVDNSGANGRLLVTAVGDPTGVNLVVGDTRQQMMRYGMDYERLWFWTSGLDAAERDDIAKWSAIDTRIDYIRVAINCGYEANEGEFNLRAYTDRIIPMMQEMKDANPDIKFFASPRPLDEAVNGAAWQPYPRWITGDDGSGRFDFNPISAGEYLVRYIELMKSYGFKISFMDLTNEWQNPGGTGRMSTSDFRDISEYLEDNLDPEDMPLLIGCSAWNYSQGASWVRDLRFNSRRNAVDIAACHNTNRTGTAQQFADAVREELGPDVEIWNTEVHGWTSTSDPNDPDGNETISFFYMLEKIRAGFSGLNGWLAIGTTRQRHSYILNPSGTPTRNVKYFIFRKLSETSNYGHALNIIDEPSQLSHTAALIKGNLMTVWVINRGQAGVPLIITPTGRTISESSVKRTRWTDPDDVEGFVTFESVTSNESFFSNIPGESVCCFEVLLDPLDHPYTVIEAEDEDERSSSMIELPSGDVTGTSTLFNITDSSFARYNDVSLVESSAMRFRVARPAGQQDGWVEVYLGSPGASTASILAGKPVGKVAVPVTGSEFVFETIETTIESAAGDFDVVLNFDEVGSNSGGPLFNLNSLSVVSPESAVLLGDCNLDGVVNFSDIPALVNILLSGVYVQQADCNEDEVVNFSDIPSFVGILTGV